jgi:hypothetical protein
MNTDKTQEIFERVKNLASKAGKSPETAGDEELLCWILEAVRQSYSHLDADLLGALAENVSLRVRLKQNNDVIAKIRSDVDQKRLTNFDISSTRPN